MGDFETQVQEIAEQEGVVGTPNPENAGQDPVVEGQEGAGGKETAGEGEGTRQDAAGTGGAARSAGERQSRQDNRAAKMARQTTEARLRAEYDGRIAAARIDNPYTGKKIENMRELEEFSEQSKKDRLESEAKRTGRSVSELREEEENREFLSGLRRHAKQAGSREAEQDSGKMDLVEDVRAFSQAYPGVDPLKLELDGKFQKFAKGRIYREPLAEIYADYLEVMGEAAKTATAKAKSKEERSTGSGGNGGGGTLTAAQQKELDAWNQRYPSMKMTAKEFFTRS